jgi:hypothetical protein
MQEKNILKKFEKEIVGDGLSPFPEVKKKPMKKELEEYYMEVE